MFGVWYGSNFLPRPEPDVEGVEISVATYNVLGGLTDANETFAVADALDADVIAFQEAGPTLVNKLDADLRDEYPYQASLDMRLALISRYPILESELPPAQRYMRVVLDVQGQRVVVYVFHASIPAFEVRRNYNDDAVSADVWNFVALLRGEVEPMIVFCDCNSTPRSRQYAWIDALLDEAFGARGRGFGLTFPANKELASMPLIRIDYVWYSHHFEPIAAQVWEDSGGSDHYPLVARLDLRSP